MDKLFSPRLALLPKHGHRVILVAVLFAVALVLGAFSFAPAAHAAVYTVPASQLAPADCSPFYMSWNYTETDGQKCIGNGQVWISAWVRYTKSNGLCARVKAIFNTGAVRYSPKACGPGYDQSFIMSERASNVTLYLEIVPPNN